MHPFGKTGAANGAGHKQNPLTRKLEPAHDVKPTVSQATTHAGRPTTPNKLLPAGDVYNKTRKSRSEWSVAEILLRLYYFTALLRAWREVRLRNN